MKKWIAMKLFDLAVRLDWDGAVEGAKVIVLIDGQLKAAFDDKQWRTHVWVPRKEAAPKKKMGRPVGSKNKPKVAAPAPKKKMGRPLGSKNKPKVV